MIVCWLTLQILAASPVVYTVFCMCLTTLSLAVVQLVKTESRASSPANQPRMPRPPCHDHSTRLTQRPPMSHSVPTSGEVRPSARNTDSPGRRGKGHPFPRPALGHAILARRPNSTGVFYGESISTYSTQTPVPQGFFARSTDGTKKPCPPCPRRQPRTGQETQSRERWGATLDLTRPAAPPPRAARWLDGRRRRSAPHVHRRRSLLRRASG